MQELARQSPLGIPITFSTDPRHSFSDNPATSLLAGPFSQWPEMLGFGALDDPELVERFADIVRREYLAVGIRTALHPQIDIATEPRWSRASTTFGSSADVVGRLGAAYVRGLQGAELGADSVSAMAKHFPGGGPQKDGEDPHFSYGRSRSTRAATFEYHLEPFKKLIAAGVSQMMPYYGMPVGTEFEEVGFNFNKVILTDILRDQLGFDGIICTDWGIVSRQFWGVEDLTEERADDQVHRRRCRPVRRRDRTRTPRRPGQERPHHRGSPRPVGSSPAAREVPARPVRQPVRRRRMPRTALSAAPRRAARASRRRRTRRPCSRTTTVPPGCP